MKKLCAIPVIPLIVTCLLLPATALAQLSATELDRVFASDAENGDSFGWAVDVDGDRAVVGAPNDDEDGIGANSGAVYVYLRNANTGLWEEEDKLVMQGMAAGDNFGASVAIEGDTIVVGAPQDDISVGSNFHGSAHVFTRGPGGWDSGVELLPMDADLAYENYGISVDIDGGTIVVGVAYDSDRGIASGSAYVFEWVNAAWQKTAKLLPPAIEANQNFGWSVAIAGDAIIVGAPHWTAEGVGAAYVFDRSEGVWDANGTKLNAIDNLSGDNFGWSVDMAGDIAVVGARFDDDPVNGIESGSISIFEFAMGSWIAADKLTASNGEAGDYFGFAVATNGTAVAAGASQHGSFSRGSVYLFSAVNGSWVEDHEAFPSSNPTNVSTIQQFGGSVAAGGEILLVGARTSDIYNGAEFKFVAGAAFVYGLNATSIPTADGSNQLVIQSPAGTFLSNVSSIDPIALGTPPPDVGFPLGALGFEVGGLAPGAAVEVEILYPEAVSVSSYFKFGDDWYEFLDDGSTGAVLEPGKVTLKLVDGGRGDHDGMANGIITDPGAIALISVSDMIFEDGFED